MKGLFLGVLLLPVASAVAIADDAVSESGTADFASYCASCHGIDGRGNGPLAPSLRIALAI
jgi:mono/diheme cytochrome c family protein